MNQVCQSFYFFFCPFFLSFFPQEASFKLVVNSFVKRLENTRVKNLLAPIKVKGFLNCIVVIEVATTREACFALHQQVFMTQTEILLRMWVK